MCIAKRKAVFLKTKQAVTLDWPRRVVPEQSSTACTVSLRSPATPSTSDAVTGELCALASDHCLSSSAWLLLQLMHRDPFSDYTLCLEDQASWPRCQGEEKELRDTGHVKRSGCRCPQPTKLLVGSALMAQTRDQG